VAIVIIVVLYLFMVQIPFEINKQMGQDKIKECLAISQKHLDNDCGMYNDRCWERQDAENKKCMTEFDALTDGRYNHLIQSDLNP
jgi:PDZ domain-containing secreted protein